MRGKRKKLLSLLTAIALGATTILGSGIGVQAKEDMASKLKAELLKKVQESQGSLSENSKGQNLYGKDFDENGKKLDENEEIRVIVQLKDSPAIKSEANGYNSNVKTKENSVKNSQKDVISKVEKITGTKVKRSFGYLVNGFSISTQRKNLDKIAAISGVKNVTEVKMYYPDMSYANNITGATSVWKDLGYKGEGMVVSIIDSGIDYRHKDLSNIDTDKIKITDSEVSGTIEQLKYGKHFTNKVPYGYNYADGNNDIIDVGAAGEHGMHVAGIVGANGEGDEVEGLQAVQGVAPQAQLLAMKVFSNNPNNKGAYDDDIIAAIEDSVKLGADVINMSLGSDAGFSGDEDPSSTAIKNATDKGVICVISAGNSQVAVNYDSWSQPMNLFGLNDTGLVGSPSTTTDALSVASMENTNSILPAISYESIGGAKGSMQYASVSGSNYDLLKDNHKLVFCGIGDVSDYDNIDVQGKVALVIRGDISFAEKYTNAVNNGAAGVIIYNHQAGGDETISMAIDAVDSNVPVLSIGYRNGENLRGLAAKGDDTFKFITGGAISNENVDKNDMSQFTSWGPTQSLDFKPEITAPGGDIYSLANDNSYSSKSGTSMSSPHTAGAQALIMQGIKNSGLNLSGRELVLFAKNTAMNTAEPMIDKYGNGSTPYSPRRQGAGLLQIENAINNKVLVTNSNGQASVALKEIGNETSFDLTLRNYGNEDITYNIPESKVYSEVTDRNGLISEVELQGASIIFDKSSVTVPANGSAKVKATVKINSSVEKQKFVEGYVRFVGNNNVPSLVMPYMGFYGDWSMDPIVDLPAYTDNPNASYLGETALIGVSGEDLEYIGGVQQNGTLFIDKSKMAFSPNGDGTLDELLPYLYMLRSSKELKVQILDKDGNVLTDLYKEEKVRRTIFEEYVNQTGGPKLVRGATWDGTIYNMATGNYEDVEDGDYTVRIVNSVDLPNAPEQTLDMPIKLDTIAPEVSIQGIEKYVDGNGKTHYILKWKASDEASGLMGLFMVAVGENIMLIDERTAMVDGNGNYYASIPLSETSFNEVAIATIDNAGNIGLDEELVDGVSNPSHVAFSNLYDDIFVGTEFMVDGKYPVQGVTSNEVSKLMINDEEVEIVNNRFVHPVSLTEGENEVNVYAEDSNGEVILNDKLSVYLDMVAPTITVAPDIGTELPFYTTQDDSIELQVSVNEENEFTGNYVEAYLMTQAGLEAIALDNNGNAKMSVDLYNGLNSAIILAADAAGNVSVKEMVISKYDADDNLSAEFFNLENFMTVSGHETVDDVYTIVGKLSNMPKEFKINGVDVNVNEDLTFFFDQKLQEGRNNIKVYLVDKNDKVVSNENYRVLYDAKAPTIKLNLPTIRDDEKIYTNNEDFTIKGTVSDNLYGYSLFINGDSIFTIDKYPSSDQEILEKEFSKLIKLQDGVDNNINIKAVDQFGNGIEEVIKVVLDKVAPVKPSINLSEGGVSNKPVKVSISSNETQIDRIEYSFDGENYLEYNGEFTVEASAKVYARVIDYAGNIGEVTEGEIKIDTTIPKVTITNIVEGSEFFEAITPNVVVEGENATLTLLLNGQAYDGSPIDVAGDYKLEAYATSEGGNKSLVVTRNFKVSLRSYEELVNGKTVVKNNDIKTLAEDYVFTSTTSDDVEVKLSTAVLTENNKSILINTPVVRTKLDKGILSLSSSRDLSFIQKIYGDEALLGGLKSVGKIYDLSISGINNIGNNNVSLSIVLNEDQLKGLNSGRLSAYYYDGSEWKIIEGGVLNNSTSIFTFKTNKLGKFTIAEKPEEANNGGNQGGSNGGNQGGSTGNTSGIPSKTGDNTSTTLIMVLFVLMLCSGTGVVVLKRRKKVER